MYQLSGALLTMMYYTVFACCTTYLGNTNDNVVFHIYHSIVCAIISALAITVTGAHLSHSPFATSPTIKCTLQFMITFLVGNIGLMAWQRNTNIQTWGRQLFCLGMYLILVEYYEYPMKVLMMTGISETLFVLNGIEAVMQPRLHYNINVYRMIVLLWVRFPMWLYIGFIVFHPEAPWIYRLCGWVGMVVMLNVDARWFRKCYRIFKTHNLVR